MKNIEGLLDRIKGGVLEAFESLDIGAVPPVERKLLNYGVNVARDGRRYIMDNDDADLILAMFQHLGTRIPFDYQHQSLGLCKQKTADGKIIEVDFRSPNGQALAAGWIKKLEARADGLYAADIEWTPAAAMAIRNREYGYISPVLPENPERPGHVLMIHSVALTNTPALIGISPLAASVLPDQDNADPSGRPSQLGSAEEQKETKMDLKALLEILGLPETATAEEALAKVKELCAGAGAASALTAEAAVAKSVRGALKLIPTAPEPEVMAALNALTARPEATEIARLSGELKTLKDQSAATEAERLVAAAMSAGKVTPALKDWALGYAKADAAAFSSWADKAPAVIPVEGIEAAALSDRANAGSAAAAIPAEIRRQFPSLTDADLKQG